ncbi:ABC transporter permease [Acidocella sp.]|uniref:cell division protein FtsX n=1 Tax=Acidocella sp. TaxID=50710 RepID=UPI002638ED65|nr:FtsX-like permease family protein [Acidocella sp.]
MANLPHPPADFLGLRTALSDRLLPLLVGAMAFLAALGIAGAEASASLAAHWQQDAAAALTIQVPDPQAQDAGNDATRLAAVLGALKTVPAAMNVAQLSPAAVNQLLSPWLGTDPADLGLPLPAVITAHWAGAGGVGALRAALQKLSPGTLVDTGALWTGRVAALTTSLQACAAAVLIIVALIGAAVVSVATHAGLAQRRETIVIVHELGAFDGDIASLIARRILRLTVTGALTGTALALPVLAWLARLAAPFAAPSLSTALLGLPAPLWAALPALPVLAAFIGWGTAQLTVRGWLRTLP